MTGLSRAEAERIAREGAAALQGGDAASARTAFERLAAAGMVNAQIHLLLAHSCRLLGDREAEERALDALLAGDGRNLRALILKGDCRAAARDERAASSFYRTAARLGAGMTGLPPDLAAELARAERASAQSDSRYRASLDSYLAANGMGPEAQSPRFRESLALLNGEKEIYFQKPSAYYFPGLPQRQFYERSEFAWAEAVEAVAGDMRRELAALIAGDAPFKPYLESRRDRPNYDFHGLLDNPDWSTLYLWENGGPNEANIERCPKTFAAVQQAPLCRITTRAPSILFSLLKGGARIAPHHGMINTRLICHLPLVVPPGCGFRVGNETREWEPGKLLIFDDTIEHEAWNGSGDDRIILIFDVWRPELTEDERRAVTMMFEAIDGGARGTGPETGSGR
jgi:aspartyl/asparaginyl beta-hydroxylase (cupin superfamily)